MRYAKRLVLVPVVCLLTGCSAQKEMETRTVDLGNGVALEMVWCPPGNFLMGTPWSERFYEEEAQHRVKLTKGFWIGKYEVTQEQWQHITGSNPAPPVYKGPKLPAFVTSWHDCQEFLRALHERDLAAGTFRLPTEAEWEYACRAGTTTRYSFGHRRSDLWKYGNYGDRSHKRQFGWAGWRDEKHEDGHAGPAPVGSFKPNAWGLHDMHGNVSEWCQDWYGPYSDDAAVDPSGPSSGYRRVQRGGDFGNSPDGCRSAFRRAFKPSLACSGFGLRVVLSGRHGRDQPRSQTNGGRDQRQPKAKPRPTTDDMAVLSAALSHFATADFRVELYHTPQKPTGLVISDRSKASRIGVSPDEVAEYRGRSVPRNAERDLLRRSRRAASLTGLQDESPAFVTATDEEITMGVWTRRFPNARAWVKPWLPGYGPGRESALVVFAFGPRHHSSYATYVLKKRDGQWQVEWHHFTYCY